MSQSRSRLSRSKGKITTDCNTSTEMLHKGIRRKVSQNQYVKFFPKLKINLASRVNTTNCLKNQYSQQYFHQEVYRMKEDNKNLEEINQELKASIRRENKLNEIFERRIQNRDIIQIPFEKLLQVKLLLEVEALEEVLNRKQEEHQQLLKQNKKKLQETSRYTIDPFIQLHIILSESESDINRIRDQKISELNRCGETLNNIIGKIHKLKTLGKHKIQQLKNIYQTIATEQLNLPKKNQLMQQSNDSGIYSMQNRSKNIDEVQVEIQKIKTQYQNHQIKIQHSIDKNVEAKILLYKQMEEWKNKMLHNGKTSKGQCKILE